MAEKHKKMSEDEKIKPDRTLDCVGLYCPILLFDTTQEMKKLEAGQVLEMVTDDPAAVQDIPRWAKGEGHRFLKLFEEGEHFHILIRKGRS